MSSSQHFKRAIIQHYRSSSSKNDSNTKDDDLRPGGDYAEPLKILKSQGVEIFPAESVSQMLQLLGNSPELQSSTIVIGDWSWTNAAVAAMKLPPVSPPDYPKCIEYLLHRTVGTATLKEMPELVAESWEKHKRQIFIKPAEDAKSFSGIIEPKDQMLDAFLFGIPGVMEGKNPNMKVFWSEVVEMGSEYRVYIVNGEIVGVCKYVDREDNKNNNKQDRENSSTTTAVGLDMTVVKEAIDKMKADPQMREVLSGCSMDMTTIMKKDDEKLPLTTLIECNEGMSLGRYPGLEWEKYTELLCSRWKASVSKIDV